MEETKQIDASTLRQWLEFKRHILVVDIRTAEERKEWFIPGIVTSRLGKEAFVKNIISKLPPPPSNY